MATPSTEKHADSDVMDVHGDSVSLKRAVDVESELDMSYYSKFNIGLFSIRHFYPKEVKGLYLLQRLLHNLYR